MEKNKEEVLIGIVETLLSENTQIISDDDLKNLDTLRNIKKAKNEDLEEILEKVRFNPLYLNRLAALDSEIFYGEKKNTMIKYLLPLLQKIEAYSIIPTTAHGVNRIVNGEPKRMDELDKEYKIKKGDIIEAPWLSQKERTNGERREEHPPYDKPDKPLEKIINLPDGFRLPQRENIEERREKKLKQAFMIYNPQKNSVKFVNSLEKIGFGYCPVCSTILKKFGRNWERTRIESQYFDRALVILYCQEHKL